MSGKKSRAIKTIEGIQKQDRTLIGKMYPMLRRFWEYEDSILRGEKAKLRAMDELRTNGVGMAGIAFAFVVISLAGAFGEAGIFSAVITVTSMIVASVLILGLGMQYNAVQRQLKELSK